MVIVKGAAVSNDFSIPFLAMPSQDLGVISTYLFRFRGPYGAQGAVLPTLIVQRFVHNGFMRGATR
ncbi:hypothetical protein GCM10010300_10440 [Streptomyces olivaceoviridis]|nr:hypothetical protein GCM10010300_10440 [Streptomyces olivaceoviridis]